LTYLQQYLVLPTLQQLLLSTVYANPTAIKIKQAKPRKQDAEMQILLHTLFLFVSSGGAARCTGAAGCNAAPSTLAQFVAAYSSLF
jgi:hypothetical protein